MEELGGRKDDSNTKEKPRWGLLPHEALEDLVRLYSHGAAKYEARNWEKGMSYERVFNALNRHLWAWWRGETYDLEGFHHLIAVAWNAFTLFTYQLRGLGVDDRPKV